MLLYYLIQFKLAKTTVLLSIRFYNEILRAFFCQNVDNYLSCLILGQ